MQLICFDRWPSPLQAAYLKQKKKKKKSSSLLLKTAAGDVVYICVFFFAGGQLLQLPPTAEVPRDGTQRGTLKTTRGWGGCKYQGESYRQATKQGGVKHGRKPIID